MYNPNQNFDPDGSKMRKLMEKMDKLVAPEPNPLLLKLTDPDEGDRLFDTDCENNLTHGWSNIH